MPPSRKDFLTLARARWTQANDADHNQRKREIEDLRFYAGEQWDKDLLDSRGGQTINSGTTAMLVPARPSLVINKTREPVRSVLNQERQSEFGIELVPADDWGDTTGQVNHDEIELREGLVRRIQRDSEAADARTWAFERAVIAGRGYWLVNTRYVPGKTWDQEVYIHRIYNQASVLIDPAHEQPDGSDALWGFIGSDLPFEVYKAKFPKRNGKTNRVASIGEQDDEWRALGDEAPTWFTTTGETRYVRVVDYYYCETETKELALLEDGSAAWADELPEGAKVKDKRAVEQKVIKWCQIDGCDDDVLDETTWPGHYLPIIKVLGEELQPYDNQRRAEGIVRPMRDPCMGNNYIVSKFAERVGLTPIPPWMMAAGQDEGFEDEYNAANTRTLSRLHYNQVDSRGSQAPPPFRPDARAEIADIAAGVQMFSEAIVSTSRVPETALGHIDPSVKSGKLAKALIDQAQEGNSNYLDNLRRSLRHEARVVNDLLYPIYGRPGRLARMMDPSGKLQMGIVGQPFVMTGQPGQQRPQPVQPGQPLPQGASGQPRTMQLTEDAEFNVAVKVSQNSDTRRQQVAEQLGQLLSASPEQMQVIGDLFWKYLDAPEHEEIAQRYKAILLPQVQAAISGQQQLPPEVQQQFQILQQQLKQAMELADKNKAGLIEQQMRNQADLAKSDMDNKTKIEIAKISAGSQLMVADLKAQIDQASIAAEQLRTIVEAAEEKRLSAQEHQQDMQKDAHQQQHERGMAVQGHQQAMAQAQQGHAHAMQQGAAGHQQALEQGAQAHDQATDEAITGAALQPQEPSDTAGA